jgi:hypothetical protein
MSRLDPKEVVSEVLREFPDISESLRSEIARAALESDAKRVAALRRAIERASDSATDQYLASRHA